MGITPRQRELLAHTWVDFMPMQRFAEAPLIVERADGVYYWDVAGKRYLDAIGGVFVASLGHRHPRLLDAVRTQLERLTLAPPMHGVADVTLELVDRLGAVTPGDLDFIKTFSGGSEANEAAIKLARQYWKQSGHPGKYKVISRYFGYHGSTFGAMAASGTGPRKSKFEPQMGGFVKVFPPTHYRDRFATWEECNRFAAASVEDVIVAEDPDTVAAVMLEPIGNTGGIITPTGEYLALLREICDRHSVLLIFDEVISGFGKTGSMFAAQTFGVTPDVICCGKGMSSGVVPIGAIAARRGIGAAFWGDEHENVHFAHGNTYAGNPLAAAAAIAVLDVIADDDLCARARDHGAWLRARLEASARHRRGARGTRPRRVARGGADRLAGGDGPGTPRGRRRAHPAGRPRLVRHRPGAHRDPCRAGGDLRPDRDQPRRRHLRRRPVAAVRQSSSASITRSWVRRSSTSWAQNAAPPHRGNDSRKRRSWRCSADQAR